MISPRHKSFDPLISIETKLLICGSLPGAQSLKTAQYYGNPRNQFWALLESVFGLALTHLEYSDRLEALQKAGIGLWDVIASAERRGSLDADINDAEVRDLHQLASLMPNLRMIAFNGGTAAKVGRKIWAAGPRLDAGQDEAPLSRATTAGQGGTSEEQPPVKLPILHEKHLGNSTHGIGNPIAPYPEAIAILDLPSSSPAYTRPFAEKLLLWQGLKSAFSDD